MPVLGDVSSPPGWFAEAPFIVLFAVALVLALAAIIAFSRSRARARDIFRGGTPLLALLIALAALSAPWPLLLFLGAVGVGYIIGDTFFAHRAEIEMKDQLKTTLERHDATQAKVDVLTRMSRAQVRADSLRLGRRLSDILWAYDNPPAKTAEEQAERDAAFKVAIWTEFRAVIDLQDALLAHGLDDEVIKEYVLRGGWGNGVDDVTKLREAVIQIRKDLGAEDGG